MLKYYQKSDRNICKHTPAFSALNARWQNAHALNACYRARARRRCCLLERVRGLLHLRDGAFSGAVYRAVSVRYRHHGHAEELKFTRTDVRSKGFILRYGKITVVSFVSGSVSSG